jgi:ribonuclease E
MLIDATQPEETRVAVVSGTRLEEFDFETATKKQLKGNIYLAKVVRVEPSLQAAFVDYGGNRHGFLAFSEIHPDYYRIPIADRAALLAEEAEMARAEDRLEALGYDQVEPSTAQAKRPATAEQPAPEPEEAAHEAAETEEEAEAGEAAQAEAELEPPETHVPGAEAGAEPGAQEPPPGEVIEENTGEAEEATPEETASSAEQAAEEAPEQVTEEAAEAVAEVREAPADTVVETLGGEETEAEAEAEVEAETMRRPRRARRYKIQEVIKRRQVMLVQVTKEERGTKGAALTTRLSLAGRYCVLMPNTGRGGGISRKITNAQDRKRLKEIVGSLEIPEGISVIVRTAGASRTKAEIKRDFDYLLRLWTEIRERTLKSTAPALIYEEANLIKRSIRDLYGRDMDDILVEGEEGYRNAKEFMRTLMPSHARRVKPYRNPAIPLFQRYQIESQIDAIYNPVARLKSGGYIVINQTEALVAIDVNSGRATRERNIEETATRTNLEAADEIARQIRLRDMAGLIVIDFIDMEENRNQRAVEKRLKEAMRHDRARIQLGRISPFGLLELSRQRLRPSLHEVSTERCPHCQGSGVVRSTESSALQALRAVEEEGIKRRSAELAVFVPPKVALYILNQKRGALSAIEERYRFRVFVNADEALLPPDFRIEVTKARTAEEVAELAAAVPPAEAEEAEVEEAVAEAEEMEGEEEMAVVAPEAGAPPAAEAPRPPRGPAAAEEEEKRGRRRRRRGKRGGRRRSRAAAGQLPAAAEEGAAPMPAEAEAPEAAAEPGEAAPAAAAQGKEGRPARRGRRRRRRERRPEEGPGAPRATREAEAGLAAAPQGGNGGRGPSEERALEAVEPARDREAPGRMERAAETRPEMAEAEAEPGAEESKAKRRGWWQRLVQ